MIDLINQNINQNLIYRITRDTIIIKGKSNVDEIYEKIKNQPSDLVYSFMDKSPVYSIEKINIFGLADHSINKLFKNIVNLIKQSCMAYELNYDKNRYYIAASIIEDQNPDFWYDTGGTSKPALFGIVCLEPAKIKINEKEMILESGEIILSEAGNKIVYSHSFKSIVFYVAPLSMIQKQYSQNWIPLI